MQNNIWCRASPSVRLNRARQTAPMIPSFFPSVLPSLGPSSIQTANRPPAGRLTVAKRFMKAPLSRRGVKGSGVAAAEVRATMPRFDCSPEIRLIWTDAPRGEVKAASQVASICAATHSHSHTHTHTHSQHVWLRMESLFCISSD